MKTWSVAISHFNGRYESPVRCLRVQAVSVHTALARALREYKQEIRKGRRISAYRITATDLGKTLSKKGDSHGKTESQRTGPGVAQAR